LTRRLILAGAVLIAAGLICWLGGVDLRLHDPLRLPLASPARTAVIVLSSLGGLSVMGPLALAAVILLAIRGRRRNAVWLFATIVSGRLVVEGVKLLVMRPRPPQADWLDPVASWSFPSSHSAGTMLTCVALGLLAGTRPALAAGIAFAVLIGWSRLALGVHWPGDVLAGWGFALVWLGVASQWLLPSSPQKRE
jgi:undecaprenyl-diphosphatase